MDKAEMNDLRSNTMKDKMIIEPTTKPRLSDFRTWLAFRLVDLANVIRPGNEAAMTYMMGIMQESSLEEMLYGRSVIEIKVKKQSETQKRPKTI